ncbi:hypothetical protein RISK_006614 [Rhodopirellula islandica]|uniref:Uncharacterized protein n=1 Tax=Rhodopirellula islandica TaxID=595434 RepID=A0A0J1B4D1_RHOIS|nr:hypothetical protein RISK_006614 [Rhodopirellula islandica]
MATPTSRNAIASDSESLVIEEKPMRSRSEKEQWMLGGTIRRSATPVLLGMHLVKRTPSRLIGPQSRTRISTQSRKRR